jgi:histidine triad (HIT) family protein
MVRGNIAVDKLYDDELVFVVRDIQPRAPVHVLVIPKEHIPTAADVRSEHGPIVARLFEAANRVAGQEGIAQSGYRLAINYGPAAGMTISHLHMHVLAGRNLGPEG